MEDYERVLLVKSDVFIYKIPPRTSNRAYRAADWKLDAPDWSGRLRLVAKGKECILKLEDKISGELFAKCPVDRYPGIAIESVSDSSRYFVIRLQDDSGRNAFIGIGFSDRSDSFDMNVCLQDHFKGIQKEEELENEPEVNEPKLDLGFKEGQTIKVNLNITKKSGSNSASNRTRTKPVGGIAGGGILLPPPPGGTKTGPPKPVSTSSSVKPNSMTTQKEEQLNDFLLDLNSLTIGSNSNTTDTSSTVDTNNTTNDLFGDFESSSASKESNTKAETDSWTQFL